MEIFAEGGIRITQNQGELIARTANYYNACVRMVEEEDRDEDYKALMRVRSRIGKLLRQQDEFVEQVLSDARSEEVEPPAYIVDPSLYRAERALEGVIPYFRPLPSRAPPWQIPAQMIWQDVAAALRTHGKRAGTGNNSRAVRLTREILLRLGYPGDVCGVTLDAVSMWVRRRIRK